MSELKFIELIKKSILRIQSYEPSDSYFVGFSGGKDSIVIADLCKNAGVKYELHYNMTTIDPPEIIYFMRENYPELIWDRPEMPFLKKLITQGFPLRQARWCCELYKENGGSGRIVITGVRAAESARRAKRKMVEVCYKDTTKRFLHPIHDWSENDVWKYIKENNLPYPKLYDEGWKRVGCLFCPYASTAEKRRQMKRYPAYTRQFIRSFEKLYALRKSQGKKCVDRWESGEDMFFWWILGNEENFTRKNQMTLFDDLYH